VREAGSVQNYWNHTIRVIMNKLLLFCLLAVLVCWANAKKGSISKDLLEDDILDDVVEEETTTEEGGEARIHVCSTKKCRRGEMCNVNSEGEAECVCMPNCDTYQTDNPRAKVCSTRNETYPTLCDLDRDHCLCKRKQDGCQNSGVKKVQLEYYGACQEFKECSENSREQFPKRLTEWLFIVMETMEKRAKLGEYEELLVEAKADSNHTVAAIWGFCDLDKDPQDRSVSRRELQYTVRSLKVLENCLVPFLDDCDADDNRRITLPEWGECLGLPHEKISDKCRDIHQAKNSRR